MKDIAIYGFGGLGREVACIIKAINTEKPTWNMVGYFDDGVPQGEKNRYGEVLGGMNGANDYPKELAVVLAIASPEIRSTLSKQIVNSNIYFPNLIAPNVFFFDWESVSLGQGNLLGFGVRVSCCVTLGDFNILNGCVSLGHDVSLGNYNILQPDVRISGESRVENNNYIGVKALVLQGLSIGSETRIGAGSVVVRNTKDGMFYWGNPAKRIKE